MDSEALRLALGAFLTSAGFGGAAALTAAVIAYRGVLRKIAGDREQENSSDARQRWWDQERWLWNDAAVLMAADPNAVVTAVDALYRQAQTETQFTALDLLVAALFPETTEVET